MEKRNIKNIDDDDTLESKQTEEEKELLSTPMRQVEESANKRFIKYDKVVGYGSYKIVYYGYDSETAKEIAWNDIQLGDLQHHEVKRIFDEASLLSELHHPNILQLIASWANQSNMTAVFITELLKGGTLKKYLSVIPRPCAGVIKKWCKEILNGLVYLHGLPCPILHRDLKCDNIFINSCSGDIRIGDLGLSCKKRNTITRSIVGSSEFMAPEIFMGEYNEKCDIYAYGMTVLEMISNKRPYVEYSTPLKIYNAVLQAILPQSLSNILDEKAVKFIKRCIGPAQERPSALELLQDEFLKVIPDVDSKPIPMTAEVQEEGTDNDEISNTANFDFLKKMSCELSANANSLSAIDVVPSTEESVVIKPVDPGQNKDFIKLCEIHLLLRVKSQYRKFRIEFDFNVAYDTIESVARELEKTLVSDDPLDLKALEALIESSIVAKYKHIPLSEKDLDESKKMLSLVHQLYSECSEVIKIIVLQFTRIS